MKHLPLITLSLAVALGAGCGDKDTAGDSGGDKPDDTSGFAGDDTADTGEASVTDDTGETAEPETTFAVLLSGSVKGDCDNPSEASGGIPLPGWQVWFDGDDTVVETDIHGHYSIQGELPAGTATLCVSREDHTDCSTEIDVPEGGIEGEWVEALVQTSAPVCGKVQFEDGSVCSGDYSPFGLVVDATVSMKGEEEEEAMQAMVNSSGGFYFPAADGRTDIEARCDDLIVNDVIHAGGNVDVELVLPNTPPTIAGLLPWGTKTVDSTCSAGDTRGMEVVVLDIDVENLKGDELEGWCLDDNGKVTDWDEGVCECECLEDGGRCGVLVSDGNGGYDQAWTTLTPAGQGWSDWGVVYDADGAPLPGAIVSAEIGDEVVETTTNEDGVWMLQADSEPAIVNFLFLDGHVDHIRRPGMSGAAITATPCEEVTFDASVYNTLYLPSDEDKLMLLVQAGSLVDADGKAWNSEVTACLAAMDPGFQQPVPDFAYSSEADPQLASLSTAAWVDFRAKSDPTVRLQPAKEGSVTVYLEPHDSVKYADDEIPFSWAVEDGAWTVGKETEIYKGFYEFNPPALGLMAPAPIDDFGCVRAWYWADIWGSMPAKQGWFFRVTVPTAGGGSYTVDYSMRGEPAYLGPLPARTNVTIELIDENGYRVGNVGPWTVNTGSDLLTAELDDGSYDGCTDLVVFEELGPFWASRALDYFLVSEMTDGTNTWTPEDISQLYYDTIDPYGTKTTLEDWKTANGWANSTDHDDSAIYLNDFDLGFGREMHMKTTFVPAAGPDDVDQTFVAMYVTNYVDLGLAIAQDPLTRADTVAMEYSPHPDGGRPYTKFFIFDADGDRTTNVDLDGNGPKYVPDLCMNCHGGIRVNQSEKLTAFAAGEYPRSGDVLARWIPFALETFDYFDGNDPVTGTPIWTRAAQEDSLRAHNEALLHTNLKPAAREMIEGWYDDISPGDTTLPANTQDSDWLPPAWDAAATGAAGDPDLSYLYSTVVAPSCRNCHVSFDLDWAEDGDFENFSGGIQYAVCGSNPTMPHAKRTMVNFWTRGNPYQPDILGDEMDGVGFWNGTMACPDL